MGSQQRHGRGAPESSSGAAPWLRDEAWVPSNTEREVRAGGQGVVPGILDGKREGTKSLLGGWAPCSQGLWRGLWGAPRILLLGSQRRDICPLAPAPGRSSTPWCPHPHTLHCAQLQHPPLRRTGQQTGVLSVRGRRAVSKPRGQPATGGGWRERQAPAEGWEPGHSRCAQVCFQTGGVRSCACAEGGRLIKGFSSTRGWPPPGSRMPQATIPGNLQEYFLGWTYNILLRLHRALWFTRLPWPFSGKKSACAAGDLSSIPGSEDPLEKGMATYSCILAWRILWTEDPGGLPSMGWQSRT